MNAPPSQFADCVVYSGRSTSLFLNSEARSCNKEGANVSNLDDRLHSYEISNMTACVKTQAVTLSLSTAVKISKNNKKVAHFKCAASKS